jgi:hypothetical protein
MTCAHVMCDDVLVQAELDRVQAKLVASQKTVDGLRVLLQVVRFVCLLV